MTLLDAMADPQLFARWFRDPATWAAWRAFIETGGRRCVRLAPKPGWCKR